MIFFFIEKEKPHSHYNGFLESGLKEIPKRFIEGEMAVPASFLLGGINLTGDYR